MFCGYGELFIRFDVVIEVVKKLKEIILVLLRVNINGYVLYIYKKNVL